MYCFFFSSFKLLGNALYRNCHFNLFFFFLFSKTNMDNSSCAVSLGLHFLYIYIYMHINIYTHIKRANLKKIKIKKIQGFYFPIWKKMRRHTRQSSYLSYFLINPSQNFWKRKIFTCKNRKCQPCKRFFKKFWMLFPDTDYGWTKFCGSYFNFKHIISIKTDHLLCFVISEEKLEKRPIVNACLPLS